MPMVPRVSTMPLSSWVSVMSEGMPEEEVGRDSAAWCDPRDLLFAAGFYREVFVVRLSGIQGV